MSEMLPTIPDLEARNQVVLRQHEIRPGFQEEGMLGTIENSHGTPSQLSEAVESSNKALEVHSARNSVAEAFGPDASTAATSFSANSPKSGVSELSGAWPMGTGEKLTRKHTKDAVNRYDRIAISPDGTTATELGDDGVTRSVNTIYAKKVREIANAQHIKTKKSSWAEAKANAKQSLSERLATARTQAARAIESSVAPRETVHALEELNEAQKKNAAIKELVDEINHSEAAKHVTFSHYGRTQGSLLEGYRAMRIDRAKRNSPGESRPFAVRQLESMSSTRLALEFAEEGQILLDTANASEIDEICRYAIHAQRKQVVKANAHLRLSNPVLDPPGGGMPTAARAENIAIDKLRPPLSWEEQAKFQSRKPEHLQTVMERKTDERRADPQRSVIKGRYKKLRWKLGGGSH